jgi:hypothetical protein
MSFAFGTCSCLAKWLSSIFCKRLSFPMEEFTAHDVSGLARLPCGRQTKVAPNVSIQWDFSMDFF